MNLRQIPWLLCGLAACLVAMSMTLDVDALFPYSAATPPSYIVKDHTPANEAVTDAGATLGRVLFYDVRLSANDATSCSTCHQQEFAFSDPGTTSTGHLGGQTGRHSMRLVNVRHSDEVHFFWDERALSLTDQVTQPIQDHAEMGFSGQDGQPDMADLLVKLSEIPEYVFLFELAFGDSEISEARLASALSQFVSSIHSYDSRFDVGLASVGGNLGAPFPNFSALENQGKQLFLAPPGPGGGAGCQGCHRAPEFDIDPASLNNNVLATADGLGIDLTNTRSPSLRDVVNPTGVPNGPFMHNGSMASLETVVAHYNAITFNPAINPNLDPRLAGPPPPPGQQPSGQQLNLTVQQQDALVAFLKTLTGQGLYSAEQWANPFEPDGTLLLIPDPFASDCPEDLNGDEVVTVADVLAVLAAFGNTNVPSDPTNDGAMTVSDVLAVLAAFGGSC